MKISAGRGLSSQNIRKTFRFDSTGLIWVIVNHWNANVAMEMEFRLANFGLSLSLSRFWDRCQSHQSLSDWVLGCVNSPKRMLHRTWYICPWYIHSCGKPGSRMWNNLPHVTKWITRIGITSYTQIINLTTPSCLRYRFLNLSLISSQKLILWEV